MVDRIYIEATRSSPEVDCDPQTGILRLSGESYPENTFEFYRPILAWLEAMLEQRADAPVRMVVGLSYLNTGSIKSMMDLLDRLDEAHQSGRDVFVVWQCDADNERIVEMAEELLEDLDDRPNTYKV